MTPVTGPVATGRVPAGVEPALRKAMGTGARLVAARPSAYSTSHRTLDLDVDVEGTTIELVCKDLSDEALLSEARGMRPAFLDDPRREIAVYTSVLAGRDLGTAGCVAARCDPAAGRYWVVLERVRGVELYQVGELAVWATAAAWLGRAHRVLAPAARTPPAPLLRYDAAFYRQFADRALAFSAHWDRPRRRTLRAVTGRHPGLVDALVAMPVTVVHGDCSASNVLVEPTASRVCPVDWEMAAVGPGLFDLAALTAGWPEAAQRELAVAYRAGLGPAAPDLDGLLVDLDRCRLQLCLQWLGWSAGWAPPLEHRHDWLTEALALADRSGL